MAPIGIYGLENADFGDIFFCRLIVALAEEKSEHFKWVQRNFFCDFFSSWVGKKGHEKKWPPSAFMVTKYTDFKDIFSKVGLIIRPASVGGAPSAP